ncbi:hypothetical protein TrST_g3343 [Triparma strigata]|uniref:Uncharacterized protein n=1 Tax=Triparma strigata TaxID=1606541 RepID=A0A9W7AEP9_9STRA|nr:hypothetical protein TrST_g3343 [Triparma strigata]
MSAFSNLDSPLSAASFVVEAGKTNPVIGDAFQLLQEVRRQVQAKGKLEELEGKLVVEFIDTVTSALVRFNGATIDKEALEALVRMKSSTVNFSKHVDGWLNRKRGIVAYLKKKLAGSSTKILKSDLKVLNECLDIFYKAGLLLMPATKKNLGMLTGMIALKNKINMIAATVLPEGLLEQERFKSFRDLSEQETDAKDLDELYGEAEAALQIFEEMMRKIVVELGIDPDVYPLVEGEKIVDHGFAFKALTVAPPKGRERTEEKVKTEYEGNFKCMLDLVRCSIIVETEEQLAGVLEKMLAIGIVVRLKNRFANPLPTGIRDCLMNVRVGGHICEVQLHLAPIIFEKGAIHEFYNFFRDLFSGASESYAAIMDRVEALGSIGVGTGEGEGSIAWGVKFL